MKNYLKMTLFMSSLLLLALSLTHPTSAYSYNSYTYMDVSNTVSYSESLDAGSRGFTLTNTHPVSRTNPIIGCDYYDWTSDFRKCRRTAIYNGYSQDYYGYVSGNNNPQADAAAYNQDAAVKEAFKTYQQSSKQQYQLESQRISLANSRYYGYGGYGSGYSGARYYSYGW